MTNTAQHKATQSYRRRLKQRGLARFEVMGASEDRELIRSIARQLAAGGPEADRLRATVWQATSGASARTGGILAALRRSPLVGVELDLVRPRDEGRPVDL